MASKLRPLSQSPGEETDASGLAAAEPDRIWIDNLIGGDGDSVYFKDLGGRFVRADAAGSC